ncbi:uncharacterized protein LOC111871177 [Cryptotermes secundus]|nr:uncharacterized protein LOC111871177 [Cryptotermes secundus]
MAAYNVFIGIFTVLLVYMHTGLAIKCFECNSHNDSRCSQDPLPDMLKKDCSDHARGVQFTMCRKIVQNIDFEVNGNPPDLRVIRGCGWDDSNYLGRCYQRSGFGGRQEVCSCLEDYCNGSVGVTTSLTLAVCTGLILVLSRLMYF